MSMGEILAANTLKQERDELARLERMVLAQRQKVVELERVAFNSTYDANARRRHQYMADGSPVPPVTRATRSG